MYTSLSARDTMLRNYMGLASATLHHLNYTPDSIYSGPQFMPTITLLPEPLVKKRRKPNPYRKYPKSLLSDMQYAIELEHSVAENREKLRILENDMKIMLITKRNRRVMACLPYVLMLGYVVFRIATT